MRFSVLASGSKANCTFLEAGGKRVLIDCGLSGKQVALRLAKLGIDIDTLDAIFVTHEHRDHIQGVSVLSRRHKLPVFCNAATAEFLENLYGVEEFKTGSSFSLGDIDLHAFRIVHDAVDPVGFEIFAEGLKFVHATDLGKVTSLVQMALRDANAVVLESNYDKEMLQICDYPWQLKQRIASSHGHLGNHEAADCLKELHHADLSAVVLAHLSENSNAPALALNAAQVALRPFGFDNIACGAPDEPTSLLAVEPSIRQVAV